MPVEVKSILFQSKQNGTQEEQPATLYYRAATIVFINSIVKYFSLTLNITFFILP